MVDRSSCGIKQHGAVTLVKMAYRMGTTNEKLSLRKADEQRNNFYPNFLLSSCKNRAKAKPGASGEVGDSGCGRNDRRGFPYQTL